MAILSNDSREFQAKIVLVGVPNCGKLQILQDWSRRFGKGTLQQDRLGDTPVFRARFLWGDLPRPGWNLNLSVYTTSGNLEYSAVTEALLREVDGIVFVAPVDTTRAGEIRDCLVEIGESISSQGLHLRDLPVVLHYHRAERMPGFQPEDLDRFLGVEPGSIPRIVTSSENGSDLTGSLAHLLKRILQTAHESIST